MLNVIFEHILDALFIDFFFSNFLADFYLINICLDVKFFYDFLILSIKSFNNKQNLIYKIYSHLTIFKRVRIYKESSSRLQVTSFPIQIPVLILTFA